MLTTPSCASDVEGTLHMLARRSDRLWAVAGAEPDHRKRCYLVFDWQDCERLRYNLAKAISEEKPAVPRVQLG